MGEIFVVPMQKFPNLITHKLTSTTNIFDKALPGNSHPPQLTPYNIIICSQLSTDNILHSLWVYCLHNMKSNTEVILLFSKYRNVNNG